MPLDKFNFKVVIANLQRAKAEVPKLVANDTKNFFVGQFNKESWDGEQWEEVERRKAGANVPESRKTAHILVKSGRLRRALINSLKEANWDQIVFKITDVPYAKVHNNGFNGTVNVKAHVRADSKGDIYKKKKRVAIGVSFAQAHTRQMNIPKRQFMGDAKELRVIQMKRIKSMIDKIWN